MKEPLRIAFAAGGTGGHVYPALAVAGALRARQQDAEIVFFGTAGKIEERIVPREGFQLRTIWISGFHRTFRPANLLFPVKVVVAIVQSWLALRSMRPHIVVGTGGYVCGPVLWVASLMGIPTVIHESNSYPGVTTRLLAGRVTKVLVGSADTRQWLKDGLNVEAVGTPVRPGLETKTREEGCRHFGLNPDKPVVLIFGGSLGAVSMNRAIAAAADKLKAFGVQMIWQTGRAEAEEYAKKFGSSGLGWVGGYIDAMDLAYGAADVVVCRAGASTLAELTFLGKPAVLVPYPHAAADHQTRNAESMEKAGAAVLVPDAAVEQRLQSEVLRLLSDRAHCERMKTAAKKMSRPDAAANIVDRILGMVQA